MGSRSHAKPDAWGSLLGAPVGSGGECRAPLQTPSRAFWVDPRRHEVLAVNIMEWALWLIVICFLWSLTRQTDRLQREFRKLQVQVSGLLGEPSPSASAPRDESRTTKVVVGLCLAMIAIGPPLFLLRETYGLPYPKAHIWGPYSVAVGCLALIMIYGNEPLRRVAAYSALAAVVVLVALYRGGVLTDPRPPVLGYAGFCVSLAIFAILRRLLPRHPPDQRHA